MGSSNLSMQLQSKEYPIKRPCEISGCPHRVTEDPVLPLGFY